MSGKPWTPEELALLEEMYGMTDKAAGEALGRSWISIANKRARLCHVFPKIGHRRVLAKTCPGCGRLIDGSFFHTHVIGNRRWSATYCTDCSSQMSESRAKDFQEKVKEVVGLAPKNFKYWSEEEDRYLQETMGLISRYDQAKNLGRTYGAVCQRIARLGIADRVAGPRLGPARESWKISR